MLRFSFQIQFSVVLGIFRPYGCYIISVEPYGLLCMFSALLCHELKYTGIDISHGLACGPLGS